MIYEFLLTLAIEFVILLVFFRISWFKVLGYGLAVNLLTWPMAQLVYEVYRNLLLIELGVFIAEGFLIMLLFKARFGKAFIISFIMNLLSFIAGLIILF